MQCSEVKIRGKKGYPKVFFIYLTVPLNPPNPLKKKKREKTKNGTSCPCWKSFTVTYCYHGSRNGMNLSNVITSNVLLISEGFLSKGFLRICWGMHQQFGFTPITAIATIYICFIYCSSVLYLTFSIVLFYKKEWCYFLGLSENGTSRKGKKKKKTMAEECRRESGSPSCSIVFLCVLWPKCDNERDRTLSTQTMSYKMYTNLFLIYIYMSRWRWHGLYGARGRWEEGRCFGASNHSMMNVKTCKCFCFQWDNGCSMSLEKSLNFKKKKKFVFEASCPVSGLDLVRACHVFQSDNLKKKKKSPPNKNSCLHKPSKPYGLAQRKSMDF